MAGTDVPQECRSKGAQIVPSIEDGEENPASNYNGFCTSAATASARAAYARWLLVQKKLDAQKRS